jgi:hypothetical protein
MLWQSLTPVGTFCDLKHNDFLFVIINIEQIKINQTCHEVDSVYNEYEKDFYQCAIQACSN